MKSASERQMAYQKRRLDRQVRVTLWIDRADKEELCRLCGGASLSKILCDLVKDRLHTPVVLMGLSELRAEAKQ